MAVGVWSFQDSMVHLSYHCICCPENLTCCFLYLDKAMEPSQPSSIVSLFIVWSQFCVLLVQLKPCFGFFAEFCWVVRSGPLLSGKNELGTVCLFPLGEVGLVRFHCAAYTGVASLVRFFVRAKRWNCNFHLYNLSGEKRTPLHPDEAEAPMLFAALEGTLPLETRFRSLHVRHFPCWSNRWMNLHTTMYSLRN